MIRVYTDGAFSTSRQVMGWAFIVIMDDFVTTKDWGGILGGTNNRAEIHAVIEAIKYLNNQNNQNIKKFTLCTDSMYIIGTMTQNWKRSKNIDLWNELDNLVKDKKIDWQHVKGHSGNKWNELCDILAVEGSHLILSK